VIWVKDIVKKCLISMNDRGYIAVYGAYYAEGGTKSEAINNLVDDINAEKGFREIRKRLNKKRLFWNKMGMN